MAEKAQPARSGLDIGDLERVLNVSALGKDLGAVEERMVDSLTPFRGPLGEDLFRTLTAPAKRVRPALTIACARLGGRARPEPLATAAAAIELVQIGSLIHDDVLEDAATRRGHPTVNATQGIPVALVVGDLVLARAGTLAAELGPEALALLSESTAQMCVGQLEELRQAFDVTRTEDAYLASLRGKTGALFAAACSIGGLVGGISRRQQSALMTYGSAFGVVYQMVDDVLDLTGEPGRLGKPIGVDIPAGVFTAPVIGALKRRGGKTLARLLLTRDERKLAEATKRVLASGALVDAEAEIYALADDAAGALSAFGKHPVAQGLGALPRYYVDWAFANLRSTE